MSHSTYPIPQFVQDVDLDQCLLVEPFFVANDLDSAKSAVLVINASHNLTETTLSEHVNNFVAVRQVVSNAYVVIASLVIISKVVGAAC